MVESSHFTPSDHPILAGAAVFVTLFGAGIGALFGMNALGWFHNAVVAGTLGILDGTIVVVCWIAFVAEFLA